MLLTCALARQGTNRFVRPCNVVIFDEARKIHDKSHVLNWFSFFGIQHYHDETQEAYLCDLTTCDRHLEKNSEDIVATKRSLVAFFEVRGLFEVRGRSEGCHPMLGDRQW